ncbi:MAG TPA: acyltransferase [Candidatus Kapabacteria bacterium]|jgi:peptidoglycan/LPS O-acetylase OafA/YrhL
MALDGLRGMAVLLVMLHHFVRSYDSQSSVHLFLLHATEFMWSGVDLFFVLSGFLITGILLAERGWPYYFRNFYGRRILRIFPLYYALLLFAFIILPFFHLQPSSVTRADALYFLTFTSNIHFALSGWSFHAFDVYWSLAVEEQFYLFWPLILLLVPSRYQLRLVLLGFIAGIIFRFVCIHAGTTSAFLYAMLPCHADGLLAGAALAIIAKNWSEWPHVSRWASLTLAFLVTAFLFTGSFREAGLVLYYDAWNTRGALFYYPILAGCFSIFLYLCIVQSNPIQRFFKNSQLRSLGKYSYCLYLIHQPIAHVIHSYFGATLFEHHADYMPGVLFDLIQITPLFLVSFAGAALSWYALERPLLRLKRYFSNAQTEQPLTIAAAIP